ncbi:MAG: sensor histidine kinase [Saprospiraceae bacterium]|nr:sensor histidine kinase [Saprospiraceae bacterium]
MENIQIRPYARLITMLGDQLIKNEQFAISEIIKNAYDADASSVFVKFIGFKEFSTMDYDKNSSIEIIDDGEGMDKNTIVNKWMNPATFNKMSQDGMEKLTSKGRVVVGEKGIGRFALFKLGRFIQITTKTKASSKEYILTYNFSRYSDDFTSENGVEKEIFLEDLNIQLEERNPQTFLNGESGTKITIKDIKGVWTDTKFEKCNIELTSLQGGIKAMLDETYMPDFKVQFYLNGKLSTPSSENTDRLIALIENKAVFQITNGKYLQNENRFEFTENGKLSSILINSPEIKALRAFKNSHWDIDLFKNVPLVGDYNFTYYIFDFAANEPSKYHLKREDKNLIKKHRIYLYRDNVRVFPYGSADDDWLQIDMSRGYVRASDFPSNDQTIGYIEITKKHNTKLKDKTNREGLIEQGNETEAFIQLNKIFLSWLRTKPYAKYLIDQKRIEEAKAKNEKQLLNEFNNLSEKLQNQPIQLSLLNEIKTNYLKDKAYLERRAELTEELAGVGLSVETASHDLMLMLTKGLSSLHELTQDVIHRKKDFDLIEEELNKLTGMFSFVKNQVQDIQLLYTSSKRRAKQHRVKELLEKVAQFYERVLKKEEIKYEIEEINSPLVAKCTDAVLMQTFINLFDNSFYWLKVSHQREKKILIQLDGMKNKLIFSDNGPGIYKDDVPYIFEPFYSGKGEDGRGLGLYISRKLLNRYDYEIEVAEIKSEKLLDGANFVINFNTEKE